MSMEIEDDFGNISKNNMTHNQNHSIQNGSNCKSYSYNMNNFSPQYNYKEVFHPDHQDISSNCQSRQNLDLFNSQNYQKIQQDEIDLFNYCDQSSEKIVTVQNDTIPIQMNIINQQDIHINSEKSIITQNQSSSLIDDTSTKENKIGEKKKMKKKKKLRSTYKDINPCPGLYEYQAYLLKGNILLELNRNDDAKDYLPIGFKMNPYNTWKPIQKVIAHHINNCIEIQVSNCGKPVEDFSFIIRVLSSYGDSKYRDIALSLQKYQDIIQQTKMLEQQFEQLSFNNTESSNQKQTNDPKQKIQNTIPIYSSSQSSSSDKSQKDIYVNKNKQEMNSGKNKQDDEYMKAFFKQFYERSMEVLGSMNKARENVFFAFTMGQFDKYGFYEDMFNFGVNKNFLLLLGSEMDQVSNAFLRNGWLEIFDYQTRINNALNFITLINNGYEKEMMLQRQMQQQLQQQKQQSPQINQQYQQQSQQLQSQNQHYKDQNQHHQQQNQNNNQFQNEYSYQNSQNQEKRSSFSQSEQQKQFQQQQQYQQQQKQQQQSGGLKEQISDEIDIVVNTFDQIKVPAKMRIHDIKINQFALRINMIDISPTLLQQVHAIRQKYINEKKSVNYIQMFDQNFIYTEESQKFLQSFYPDHSVLKSTKKQINTFEIHETPSVRQEIENLRCGYRHVA